MRRVAAWCAPRLALRVLFLLGALALVFLAIDHLPGNSASVLLGANYTPEAAASLEQSLGLDQPVRTRYFHWLAGALTGDFGSSALGRPIGELLRTALPVTLITTGVAFAVTAGISIVGATWWAYRSSRSPGARVINTLSTSLIALPEFIIGVFLVAVFALGLGFLPAVTLTENGLPTSLSMYVLPITALVIPQVAWNIRVLHAALIDALHTTPVHHARLSGVTGAALMYRHVLPLALPSFAVSMGMSSGVLIAGTVSVEALFNHPGVGLLVTNAVAGRDLPVLLAVLAITGTIILAVLTLADVIKVVFTPKVAV